MIRTVVSDLGKVVLWFDNMIFLNKLAAHGRIDPAAVRTVAHENLAVIRNFDGGTIQPREYYEQITRVLGVEIDYDLFYGYYNDIFWPNPPVIEILRKVKAAGTRLVMLSNTDPMRFEFVRNRFPELGMFDDRVLSYEVRLLKPDPAIYLEAARRGLCEPGECVFIDDMPENIAGAVAAGLKGIVYKPETDLASELKKLGILF